MISSEFNFRIERPDDPLGRYVSGVWYARGVAPHRRERILASQHAVLLLVLGPPLRMTEPGDGAVTHEMDGAWITGPHESPILNEPRGETHVLGAVFAPGGLAAFLHESAAAIANRILPVAAVRSSLGSGRELLAAVRDCPGASGAISTLSRELAVRLSPPADHDVWAKAIEALMGPDAPAVAEVQRATGVSRRHFGSEVRKRTGLLPKSLQRIARMRRLLQDLDSRKPICWSSEAVGAGYFDQPHATRDFKKLTGMTPVEYVARRQLVWGHDVEPGEATEFVPETLQ